MRRDIGRGNSVIGAVAFVSLVLVAFLPSMLRDYVTMDQWRAFRYSVAEVSGHDRFQACWSMLQDFYAMTGRPLVWETECIEHALVGTISDFSLLRPVMVLLVLITTVSVGWAFDRVIHRPPVAYAGAALVVMTPAFSFMALQGVTAAAVVATVPLSAASFVLLREAMTGSRTKLPTLSLFAGAASLFLISCLIYPAWALLVVPFAVVDFLLSVHQSWKRRYASLGIAVTFVVGMSAIYYIAVRAWVSARYSEEAISTLGSYEVSADLSISRLLERSILAADYMLSLPPTNVALFGGLPAILILAFALLQISEGWRSGRWVSVAKTLASVTLSLVLMLTIGIGPWLVSGMSRPETRHLLVWSVFFAGILIGIYLTLARIGSLRASVLISLRVLGVAFVVVTAMFQYRFVQFETLASSGEFQVYRDALKAWVERQGWRDDRLVLVLRPPDATANTETNARIAGMAEALGTVNTISDGSIPFARGSAWLASADNPVSIPWMVVAALREEAGDSLPDSLDVVDCGSDSVCMSTALRDSHALVVGYVDEGSELVVPVAPQIVDISALTGVPSTAHVTAGASPEISSTSQLEVFGPEKLLSLGQPGWHAQVPVQYPQSLLVDFVNVEQFESLVLTPQDGHARRMPSRIKVEVSTDGLNWVPVATAEQSCQSGNGEPWRVLFDGSHSSRWWRVVILDNCGDPDYLTLRGLTFS